VRFDDFSAITRTRSLREPTDETPAVLALARGLTADAMPLIRARGCTLIGLSLTNLEGHGGVQLVLPLGAPVDDGDAHLADLDLAVDALRDRFGRDSITRGALLGHLHGEDAPMLPDQRD
jgi:DNA polymerase-4